MVGISKKTFSRDKADSTNLEKTGKIWQGSLHSEKKGVSSSKSHTEYSSVLWLQKDIGASPQCDRSAVRKLWKLIIFSFQHLWIAGALVGIIYSVLPSSASQPRLIRAFYMCSIENYRPNCK